MQEYRLCYRCAGIQPVLSVCRNTDCVICVQEYRLCCRCAGIQTVLLLCRNTDCAVCAGVQTLLSLCRNTSGRISWFAGIPCGDSTERWEDCDKWWTCPGCGCCGYGPAGCLRACPEGGCRRALWGLLLSFWHWPLCLKKVVMPAWGGSILTVVFGADVSYSGHSVFCWDIYLGKARFNLHLSLGPQWIEKVVLPVARGKVVFCFVLYFHF